MGIPQSPPEEKDGPLKPSGVAGEDTDTRQGDKVEARVGVMCEPWAYSH